MLPPHRNIGNRQTYDVETIGLLTNPGVTGLPVGC